MAARVVTVTPPISREARLAGRATSAHDTVDLSGAVVAGG